MPPYTLFHTPFYPIMLTLIFPLVWQIKNHQIGFFITSTYADVITFQSSNDATFYLNFWYISWHLKCIFLNLFEQITILIPLKSYITIFCNYCCFMKPLLYINFHANSSQLFKFLQQPNYVLLWSLTHSLSIQVRFYCENTTLKQINMYLSYQLIYTLAHLTVTKDLCNFLPVWKIWQ